MLLNFGHSGTPHVKLVIQEKLVISLIQDKREIQEKIEFNLILSIFLELDESECQLNGW